MKTVHPKFCFLKNISIKKLTSLYILTFIIQYMYGMFYQHVYLINFFFPGVSSYSSHQTFSYVEVNVKELTPSGTEEKYVFSQVGIHTQLYTWVEYKLL